VVVRWRSLLFVYLGDGHWRRIDLEALARQVQEVEFRDEMWTEREIRSAVVLNQFKVVLLIGIKNPRNSIIFKSTTSLF